LFSLREKLFITLQEKATTYHPTTMQFTIFTITQLLAC
jgi:hypothetical protein